MNGWLIRWILNILALLVTAAILPHFDLSVWAAIVGSVFLGIVNAAIRPVLILLTLPFSPLSLGLATVIINGFMLWLTSVTIRGFDINGFGWGLLAALLYSVLSFAISYFIDDNRTYWF